MLGLLSAGAGLAQGIAGGIMAGKARKKQMKMIRDQEAQNQEWYNKNYYANYLDSTEARAAMKRVEDTLHRQQQQAAATAAVMGGTPEAIQAQQQANNELLGDMATNLSAQGTARKNAVDAQNQANIQSTFGAKMGMQQQAAQGASQMMQNGLGQIGAGIQGSGILSSLFKKEE